MTITAATTASPVTTASPALTTERTAPRRKGRRLAAVALAALVGAGGLLGFASPAGAVAGTTGYHQQSVAQCKAVSPVMAAKSQIVAKAPVIRAANTTSALDAGTVQFRQRLIKWNGSKWVDTGVRSAVWSGFATDSTAALDFSDGTRTLRSPQITFTAGPGYYRIDTDYWWARTNNSAGGSNAAVAHHTSSPTTAYCGFSA